MDVGEVMPELADQFTKKVIAAAADNDTVASARTM